MPPFIGTGVVALGPSRIDPGLFWGDGMACGGYSSALREQQQARTLLNPSTRPQPGAQLLIHPCDGPLTPTALALGVNTNGSMET